MLTQTIVLVYADGTEAYFIGPANQIDDEDTPIEIQYGEIQAVKEIDFLGFIEPSGMTH